jgi:hypothetical protein
MTEDLYRPYSQNELNELETRYLLRLGIKSKSHYVYHENCGHHYLIKENGNKFRLLENSDSRDVGTCSVCWKLRNSNKKNSSIVNDYHSDNPRKQTLESLQTLKSFYNWLYN